ncbi:MAG: VIT and VWA domain-containing protein [Burkholderiales bacterium]|nr:VIT and VWA domain-containing protein [Burkholderiales bacterium]
MKALASALCGVGNERVALCDVAVNAVLKDLLAEVTVAQTYRNEESVNIEAVYTFPLPLDAVLLELEVEIGGRVLKGVVVEKSAAEKDFEEAIEAGDSAVMLEELEPGLYTMNVGNLLANETAKITFRYAILYRWAGDRLRLSLPTTIAPRYGDSPHQPHQAPDASLTVENQFSLSVEIFGALRDAQFVCPSHAIEMARSADRLVLSLKQPKAVMDRDYILNVRASQVRRSFALTGTDGEGMAVVASFQPFFPGLQQPRALNLAIVVDCSGSMQGDSMAQAKQALEGILDGLQSHDRVTLIAFGNTTKVFSERPLACNESNLAKARAFAKSLDADMGGTEIGIALSKAYSVLGHGEVGDIFLITDGEFSDWRPVVDEAKKASHRIFTVGVGSAVSEAFVRELATSTAGECELVSPREGMAERVVRHFERMRAPRAKRVSVRWPEGAENITPSTIGAVFEGDTVVACARFDRRTMQGAAILEVETDRGEVMQQQLAFGPAPLTDSPDGVTTVARVVASTRLKALDPVEGLQVALRYRLVSPWTNWLVIATRTEEEKAQDIPALRKVPQTLAAGWGGVGSDSMVLSLNVMEFPSAMYSRSAAYSAMEDFERSDIEPPLHALPLNLPQPYRLLLELIDADASRLDVAGALDLLTQSGLSAEFDDLVRHADYFGLSIDMVAAFVVVGLLRGQLDKFLSNEAQGALASLQDRTKEASEVLRLLGRHGLALRGLAQQAAARELFRQQSDYDTLERIGRLPEFLEHLEDALRRSDKHRQQP